MTELIRSDAPRRSLGGLLTMAGLAIGTLFFTVLSFLGIAFAWNQAVVAFWFGVVFLLLAVFFDVYRRGVVPHGPIPKQRRAEGG